MASTPDLASSAPSAEGLFPSVKRFGFVAIVGRPNVGKSTLLNRLVGEKLAIASPRPQTTRNRLLAVKNLPDAQLALLDTPGLHRPRGHGRSVLNQFMVDEALSALSEVDVVLLVTDLHTAAAIGDLPQPADVIDAGDRYVAEQIQQSGKKAVLALNKVDLVRDKRQLLPVIDQWTKVHPFCAAVPISALSGDGVDRLLGELSGALPEGRALFPEEMLTDRAERWLAAELIREQVFLATRQEVPYGVAVTVDQWEDRIATHRGGHGIRKGDRLGAYIDATIHVEKESQKKIVVGEAGHMVRDIGAAARAEIGRLLGCPVHLSLFVRVDPGWTESRAGLRKMGYEPDVQQPQQRGR